ncbi:hypothetical protein GCM10009677_27570 [Sphaerisporangium rubeum]|uniref:Apea-like HEPN domain-containing protein n=1 Tax=Sphaerisporangium rubeum TaxID=321317 RepID=A0A7X0IAJ5_9ACTN|nr:hypothetical protein [Sphaerisporangium rubeum]MBB6471667.1 hypothetical protein [Sphaerisporangium rubeum]
MQWRLLAPFIAPKFRFPNKVAVTVIGHNAIIRQASFPLSEIVVENLPSVDAAQEVFLAIKRGMLIASINLSCGIRIADEVAILDAVTPLPGQDERPFICPQDRSLARLVMKSGPVEFQMSYALPKLIHGLESGARSTSAALALSDQRLALACMLYTDSFFETSPEAQFITLIGVLEVLKEQDPVSQEAEQLIDGWLNEIRQLEPGEAQSLRGRLRSLKHVSIGTGIRRLIYRHLGPERAREVQALYAIRSKLVHEGERPPRLNDDLRQSRYIVRELLAKILSDSERRIGQKDM